jgi:broad specificity phosphatase PhoE
MVALLIRHGQVPTQDRIGLRAALGLSERGQAQVRALAERLRRFEIATVFASPLLRTKETAQIITNGREIPLIAESSLIEVNHGDWENRSFEELAEEPVWKRFNTFRGGTRIPGGEMMIEVQARIVTFLQRISNEFRDRTMALVTHADVIRAAVCHYAGIPLDLSLRVEISPASLSILEIADWGARLVRLNDTGDE